MIRTVSVACTASREPIPSVFAYTRASIYCLGFMLFFASPLYAQQYLLLRGVEYLPKKTRLRSTFPDSAALFTHLETIQYTLTQQGFLEASVDSLSNTGDSLWQGTLHLGPRYRWGSLHIAGGSIGLLRKTGFQNNWTGKPVSGTALSLLQNKLLTTATSNGYPFARVGLDSMRFHDGILDARILVNTGPYIILDTLLVEGDVRFRAAYLQRYLGIFPGTPYDQETILRLRERLRALAYLQPTRDPEVIFFKNQATIRLPLTSRNASRFDFLIGVLPNSGTTNRLLFTTSFLGDFVNVFGAGERLYLRFEQLRPQTQRLDIQATYPAVLGLPVGLDVQANLYKRDTTFLDADAHLGLAYMLEGNDYLKLFWSRRSSRILGINPQLLLQMPQLPANLDVQSHAFGLEFSRQRLDYPFNPRKGWLVHAAFSAGTKRILRNPRIEALGIGNLYDSISVNAPQYRIQARLGWFIPFLKRSTLHGNIQIKSLISNAEILQNEQFRIGGNRFLRGFDEDFFQATHVACSTLEYRLLIGEHSWIYSFADAAWMDSRSVSSAQTSYPIGWGAGITFETRAGILGISMAYGSLVGQPVDLYRPKVHLGFISLF